MFPHDPRISRVAATYSSGQIGRMIHHESTGGDLTVGTHRELVREGPDGRRSGKARGWG
jgi:hypothetical protein